MLSLNDLPCPTCKAIGCGAPAASGHLLCWEHWAMLTRDIRDRCWTAWKNWNEAREHDAKAVAHRKLLDAASIALTTVNRGEA